MEATAPFYSPIFFPKRDQSFPAENWISKSRPRNESHLAYYPATHLLICLQVRPPRLIAGGVRLPSGYSRSGGSCFFPPRRQIRQMKCPRIAPNRSSSDGSYDDDHDGQRIDQSELRQLLLKNVICTFLYKRTHPTSTAPSSTLGSFQRPEQVALCSKFAHIH